MVFLLIDDSIPYLSPKSVSLFLTGFLILAIGEEFGKLFDL